jgi:hypothetical protein
MFHIYDVECKIHHFYRHESSLEQRIKKQIAILAEKKSKFVGKAHRIRWINYFHLADSVEFRFQSELSKEELQDVLQCILPRMREVLSFNLHLVDPLEDSAKKPVVLGL